MQPVINNDRVLFRGTDGTVRLVENGVEVIIARDGDPAPDGRLFFQLHNNISLDLDEDGTAVFTARTCDGTDINNGIYQYKNGTLSLLADYNTLRPGSTNNFINVGAGVGGIGISQGKVIFFGGTGVVSGIYLIEDGVLSTIVDSSSINYTSFAGVDIDGSQVVFWADGSLYVYDLELNQVTDVVQAGTSVVYQGVTCTYSQLDNYPAIDEIASPINFVDAAINYYAGLSSLCSASSSLNQTVGTTQGGGERLSTVAHSPGSFLGQSIDDGLLAFQIWEPVLGTYSQIVIDDNGARSVAIDGNEWIDDMGQAVSLTRDGLSPFLFGDKGFSNNKLVFGGKVDGISGVVVLTLTPPDNNGEVSVQTLLNQDPESGDQMGYSVSIDADYAVVGTRLDDAGGITNSGSVEIFKRTTSGAWVAHQTLLSPEPFAQHNFGHSVGINGDFIVVGEEKNGTGGFRAGAAHLFKRNAISDLWEWTSTAPYGITKDFAGRSVAIDGNNYVVGIINEDGLGSNTGGARLVEFDNDGLFMSSEALAPLDALGGDNFGNAVSISGDYAVVGAYRDDETAAGSGSAYVFYRGAAGWSQIAKLVASDPVANDQFGYSVSIEGDTIAVGSCFADTASGNTVGAVYVYVGVDADMDGTGSLETWTQAQKLTASDAVAGDRLGTSVAIDGDRLVSGASWAEKDMANDRSGKAYLFTRNAVTGIWSETSVLFDIETTTRDEFGVGVALDGRNALVGSWRDNQPQNNSGAAYVFELP